MFVSRVQRLAAFARVTALFSVAAATTVCGGRAEPLLRYPVIYADMDGTLLGSDGKVRSATVEALRRFRACGGHVGVATGRTLDQVRPYLDELEPDLPLVLLNGAMIATPDGERVTSTETLSAEIVKTVVESSAHAVGVIGLVAIYPFGAVADRDDPRLRASLESAAIDVVETCDFADCLDSVSAERSSGPPLKLMVVAEPAAAEGAAKTAADAAGGGAQVTLSNPAHGVIEVTPAAAGKANAVARVLRERGIGPDEILVFGDGENDAEMLGAFPAGVAMGNCHRTTCDAALLVTKDADTDAIARVIEALAIRHACGNK